MNAPDIILADQRMPLEITLASKEISKTMLLPNRAVTITKTNTHPIKVNFTDSSGNGAGKPVYVNSISFHDNGILMTIENLDLDPINIKLQYIDTTVLAETIKRLYHDNFLEVGLQLERENLNPLNPVILKARLTNKGWPFVDGKIDLMLEDLTAEKSLFPILPESILILWILSVNLNPVDIKYTRITK